MKVNFTNVKFPLFSPVSLREISLIRRKMFVILLLLNMVCIMVSAQTQSKLITGSVRDEKGESLPGVNIMLKGSTDGVSADANGIFSIRIPDGKGILIFRFVGYSDQEIVVNGQTKLQVQMKPASKNLDEVVVVGYGTQKRTSVTAAVSTIKGKELASQPVANITNALGGHVAGVLFTQSSGEPGNDGSNILIRGIGTTGNTQPLVIVDGVPRNYTQLDPGSIESVSILKDAAAVAPYGLGGANGVILITTKKGKIGKPTLTYSTYYGWQNPTRLAKFVNAYQFATLFNAADDNAHPAAPHAYSADDLQKYKDHSDPNGHPDHNVLKELTNRNTPMTSQNLQLSGGSESVRYFTGVGFLSQDGLWGPTNYKRYNLTANIEADATKTTKVNVSMNGRVEDGSYPGVSASSIFYQAFRTPPNAPLTFTNGLPGAYIGRSAYGNIHGSGYNQNLGYTLLNQLSIEQQLTFVKGLSIKGVVSYDYNPYNPGDPTNQAAPIASFTRTYLTPIDYYAYDPQTKAITKSGNDGPSKPQYSESFGQSQAFTYQGYINYHNTFGKSDITGLVVLESRNTKASLFSAGRINYNVPIPELNNGSSNSTDITNSGYSLEQKQKSAIYRVSYAYDNKYLFEAAGRYDGNYYFAPGHRFGFFPSFAAGWRISEEPFIKKNFTWINNLKIRGSWGESGALAQNGPFQYLSAFQLYGNSTIIGGAATQGLYEGTQANPNITWERAKKTDVGIEGTLWNGALTFEADYFYEIRNNMLVAPTVTVPAEYGIGLSQVNGGAMSNHGLELTLGTTHRFNKDLSVSLSGNFTYSRNKQLQVFETSATYDNPNRRITGRPLGTQFGFQALGFFTPADFDASGNLKPGIAMQPWGQVYPGDLRYKDVNGDGKIDNNDIVPIGNSASYPQIIYGITPSITYKGFDLSVLFQGATGRDFYDGVYPFDNSSSATLDALDYWTPTHQNAANPRITTQPTSNNTQTSSWWVRNGAYLRLKTANLGYTLPASIMQRLHLQSVRFYVSGQNLLTWSPLKNFDPEVSTSNGQYYPQIKVVTVGLNVTF
ncbi:SusC/RagA family TonB-linked outer membrane protein [Mucilaginibacter sp. SP1R1]|uniref:SusC/RagA family TonB-linked outer membrane protein n=1 Tax=Mucilaginibacter sp. SP1R1 TaxID=2723091 RepID=UPI001791C2C6|nr:TonB-dependent receptor [Mucilaginibacter sp. SP1R1]MBB6151514.1 TonB-linked SusC/RagA family outer membrane protein [Mucilaginibacter sp. SP1R1]